MQNFDIVGALAFFTIGAVLVLGIISWIRASRAKDQHKDAAVAQRQRMEDRAPPHDERSHKERSALPADKIAPTDSGRAWSKERGAEPPTPPVTPPD